MDWDALPAVEHAFARHDEPVRFEVATLADPVVFRVLTERNYRLIGFENVVAKTLAPSEVAHPAEAMRDFDEWRDVTIGGFLNGDGTGAQGHVVSRAEIEQVFDDVRDAPGYQRYIIRMDGRAVAAASMRIDGDIVVLAGAATLPAFRRRGAQSRLLATRLRDAHAQGARLAVMTCWPGSQSQANAMRQGFSLLYARAVLVQSAR